MTIELTVRVRVKWGLCASGAALQGTRVMA
jgi:hypothetical protein